MLSAQNLQFSYDNQTQIMDGLSFDVCKGEIVSLLGPSGCGKSTVLRLIANLLEPNGGSIEWDMPTDLAFVFQDHALMPWASVSDNVALPQRLKGHVDAQTITESLSSVALEGFGDRYPAALSGGQRMRVSIARALAAKPDLLLMDEPFAALDEMLRFQMNQLLLKLRKERGFAAIFVTHSLYEAAYLSDRIAVMGAGQIKGWVKSELDRSKSPDEQRASPEFLEAVQELGALMAGGDQ